MKTLDPTIQAHAEMLVRKIQDLLARFPDIPVLECQYVAGNRITWSIEKLVLDLGGERGIPDRLVISIEKQSGVSE